MGKFRVSFESDRLELFVGVVEKDADEEVEDKADKENCKVKFESIGGLR